MEESYNFLTFQEHVLLRPGTWGGSVVIDQKPIWLCDNDKFIFTKTNLSPAVCKDFDEVLHNAQDQYFRGINFSNAEGGSVTNIWIEFNNKTGEITITNDGKGFGIYKHPKLDTGSGYTVEGLITREFGGSNFTDKEDKDRITGGLNGIGLKMVNAQSVRFEIETVDVQNKMYYHQVCENNMMKINAPTVIKLDAVDKKLTVRQMKSHTTFKFIPDYPRLCLHKKTDTENPAWVNAENLNNLGKFIEMRCYQTALFLSQINYRYKGDVRLNYHNKCHVWYNNREIKLLGMADFMQRFGINNFVEIKFEQTPEVANRLIDDEKSEQLIRFPWYICVGINDVKIPVKNMSLVNGVYLELGGSHINMITNAIKNSLEANVMELIKNRNVELKTILGQLDTVLFIVDCKQIPVPEFQGGNTKNAISLGTKDINRMKKMFGKIPDVNIKKIWSMMRDTLEYTVFTKDMDKANSKKKGTKIRKYEAATGHGDHDYLIIPEGDSAAQPIRNILTHPKTPIKRKNYGMYNIQGVPPNACKNSSEVKIEGRDVILPDRNLHENISFNGLISAWGLDYKCDYYYGATDLEDEMVDMNAVERADLIARRAKGDADFKRIRYRGGIIIATDQDKDGIGNICSLIIVFILRFWPELFKRGVIHRLQTPIIRVYMGSSVTNFYSERDFDVWVTTTYGDIQKLPKNCDIRYYKGLAGHSKEEVIDDIGMNIKDNIIKITWDDAVQQMMVMYYGIETASRKLYLTTPVSKQYTDEMMIAKEIPCSLHFEIESKDFQLYYMQRKLEHSMDGFIPTQRKVFAAARIMFRKESKSKVYQLTGYAAKKMHYQHGDTSMNETIIKMTQTFTGTNNIPIFTPISDGFGDRVYGRDEAGSPRYIDNTYNKKVMDLMFPPEDDWLLKYVWEDGIMCEPEYYVPIVPRSILETSTTTGVGWQIKVWARDWDFVMLNLRNMIKDDYPRISAQPLDMTRHVWLPKNMRVITGRTPTSTKTTEICVGSYEMQQDRFTNNKTGETRIVDKVVITQLPLKIWSYPYKCRILGMDPKTGKTENKFGEPIPAKEYVDDVLDKTGNDVNDIIVTLKPGALAKINEEHDPNCSVDAITEYLNIYTSLYPQLNMFGIDGSIKEFENYEKIMEYWFVERKKLYIQRIERNTMILELKILHKQETLRFIMMDASKEINIDRDLEDADRVTILESFKFQKFNKTNLFHPNYIKVDELREKVLVFNADYKYIDNDISIGNKSKTGIAKIQKELDDMIAELEKLRVIHWKDLWLAELSALEKMVMLGRNTDWLYDKKKHVFKKATKKSAKTPKKE